MFSLFYRVKLILAMRPSVQERKSWKFSFSGRFWGENFLTKHFHEFPRGSHSSHCPESAEFLIFFVYAGKFPKWKSFLVILSPLSAICTTSWPSNYSGWGVTTFLASGRAGKWELIHHRFCVLSRSKMNIHRRMVSDVGWSKKSEDWIKSLSGQVLDNGKLITFSCTYH